jgi:hypothetical protein
MRRGVDSPQANKVILTIVFVIVIAAAVYAFASGRGSLSWIAGVLLLLLVGSFVYRKKVTNNK